MTFRQRRPSTGPTAGGSPTPPFATNDQVDDYHGRPGGRSLPLARKSRLPADEGVGSRPKKQLTFGYLDEIPARPRIKERLTEALELREVRSRLQEKAAGTSTRERRAAEPERLLLDERARRRAEAPPRPQTSSAPTGRWLSRASHQRGRKMLAYSLSTAGSDWQEWRGPRDRQTGADRPDVLKWSKFPRLVDATTARASFLQPVTTTHRGDEDGLTNY